MNTAAPALNPAMKGAVERFDEAARVYIERTVRLIKALDIDPTGPELSAAVESWDGFPRDPDDPLYCSPDGRMMGGISTSFQWDESSVPYRTEQELAEIRRYCRWLARFNPFARCCHGNRQSYVVGMGFVYKAKAKPDETVSEENMKAAQGVIDDFVKANKWNHRLDEVVLREDRDGESIQRKFYPDDGIMRVRFVEPACMIEPLHATENQKFGVETDPEDAETVIGYWIAKKCGEAPEFVPADQIQHRKRNVDSSCRRGMPLLFGVRQHLLRAVANLRNISSASGIQTAIAMIRKHAQATQAGVRQLVADTSTQTTNPVTGRAEFVRKFEPGTILDATQNIEYDFPSQGMDPSKHIAGVQAELRAAAAELMMPEFMFTADASNGNFASTMVAEGPASKNFEKVQGREADDDRELIMDALKWAAEKGKISADLIEKIDVDIQPPSTAPRDKLKDAQANQILNTAGVLSKQTWAGQAGLEYDQEQDNIESDNERNGVPLSGDRPGLPGLPGDDLPTDPDIDPRNLREPTGTPIDAGMPPQKEK